VPTTGELHAGIHCTFLFDERDCVEERVCSLQMQYYIECALTGSSHNDNDTRELDLPVEAYR
jgi:hypothetical protein